MVAWAKAKPGTIAVKASANTKVFILCTASPLLQPPGRAKFHHREHPSELSENQRNLTDSRYGREGLSTAGSDFGRKSRDAGSWIQKLEPAVRTELAGRPELLRPTPAVL
jgi:hypothetical protein